jgi:hypothetical protein
MNAINDKIGFRRFLTRIFIAESGVSSRRVLAFIFAIQLVIMVFMKYPIGHCELIAAMIAALLALTTISSYGKKTDGEQQSNVNIENKG